MNAGFFDIFNEMIWLDLENVSMALKTALNDLCQRPFVVCCHSSNKPLVNESQLRSGKFFF